MIDPDDLSADEALYNSLEEEDEAIRREFEEEEQRTRLTTSTPPSPAPSSTPPPSSASPPTPPPAPAPPPTSPPPPRDDTARLCQHPGCGNTLSGRARKWCPQHDTARKRGEEPTRVDHTRAPEPRTDGALESVRARAESIARLVAVGFLFVGWQEDAADVERGAPDFGKATANLARHEEWLRKLLSGGEAAPDRVIAWFEFVAVLWTIASPILARHGALPGPVLRMLHMAEEQAQQMMADGAAEPVAA